MWILFAFFLVMQDGCLCTCVFKIKNVGNYCIQLVIGYSRSLIECMLLIPTFLYNNHLIGELLDIWDFFRSNLSKYGITFIYLKSSGAMVAISFGKTWSCQYYWTLLAIAALCCLASCVVQGVFVFFFISRHY